MNTSGPAPAESDSVRGRTHPAHRLLWATLAFVSLGLGIIGLFLPGLPTTPFVLLAAYAAARGSNRLHDWLLSHALFGPMIRDWQRVGAVSRPAKRSATLMMVLCTLLLVWLAPAWWMAALPASIMLVVAIWLWSLPEPGQLDVS